MEVIALETPPISKTLRVKCGEQKAMWFFLSFIISMCHHLQTYFSLYPGWWDPRRTANRNSPFLSLFFGLATWQLKEGFGRGQPLLWTFAQIRCKSFSQATGEFMCYVNTMQLTKFLFFWCVVSLSLFFPLPLQFLREAFSQAGKHHYSMHVPNLIRFFGVCFSCVCFCWCFFVRPLQSKGP